MSFIQPHSTRIFVCGHDGLLGSAVMRRLRALGYTEILTVSRRALDLCDAHATLAWFTEHKPDAVIHCAGLTGGIYANMTRPAEFLLENLQIATSVIDAAHRTDVQRLLFVASSCMYPRLAKPPITEDALMSGPLEPTNAPYALAKIAGVELCNTYRRQYGRSYISMIPTNIFGPGDKFDDERAHVLPTLLRRFHEAKIHGERQVVVWGTGRPLRQFITSDDAANASVFLLEQYDDATCVNVGNGEEVSIADLAEIIRDIVHPEAEILFDHSKTDGMPQKRLDLSRIHALGWKHSTSLKDGIRATYEWYCASIAKKDAATVTA